MNAALRLDGGANPQDVLETLHRIEHSFGRVRTVRWGPRSLDLDLIACDDLVLPDAATVRAWMTLSSEEQQIRTPEHLLLPHPRIQDRAFVLHPLAEVAPEWRHPLTGTTIREMLDALPAAERDAVTPLG